MVEILKAENRELRCLAAETIANVAHFRKARRIVRVNGGLRHLIAMLENPGRPGSPITGQRSDVEVARSAALGLWSCSKSRKNKQVGSGLKCTVNDNDASVSISPCSRPMLCSYWANYCKMILLMC